MTIFRPVALLIAQTAPGNLLHLISRELPSALALRSTRSLIPSSRKTASDASGVISDNSLHEAAPVLFHLCLVVLVLLPGPPLLVEAVLEDRVHVVGLVLGEVELLESDDVRVLKVRLRLILRGLFPPWPGSARKISGEFASSSCVTKPVMRSVLASMRERSSAR